MGETARTARGEDLGMRLDGDWTAAGRRRGGGRRGALRLPGAARERPQRATADCGAYSHCIATRPQRVARYGRGMCHPLRRNSRGWGQGLGCSHSRGSWRPRITELWASTTVPPPEPRGPDSLTPAGRCRPLHLSKRQRYHGGIGAPEPVDFGSGSLPPHECN